MSEENRSRFKFERDGVRIEITGNWGFVQKIYREVMRDVDRAGLDDEESAADASPTPDGGHVIWIIRCSDMMRRVYMADSRDFAASPLHESLDPSAIGTLYIDKPAFRDLLPAVAAGEETLWAELTEAGREELAGLDV